MLAAYRTLTRMVSPLIPFYLARRARRGKEDVARRAERLGIASVPRPSGAVLWFHAASVGESMAILPLLHRLAAAYPQVHLLLTTVTVTSAQLMASKLPPKAIHCYAPVDTPQAVGRFLAHWQPTLGVWVESELWPNMVMMSHRRAIPLFLVNGRLSARSAERWRRLPAFITPILQAFRTILASSEEDAARFRRLGAMDVQPVGNLKFSAPPLEADAGALSAWREQVGTRRCFLAASTHAGEETLAASVHKTLKPHFPELLTVIVPRHSRRGEEVAQEIRAMGLEVALRSRQQPVLPTTDIYLADTMGELGLFYRVAQVAFIGGSLVPHGGQNPFEAVRLGCAVIYGQHMENFTDFCAVLEASNAALCVASLPELITAVQSLLADEAQRQKQAIAAQMAVQAADQVMTRMLALLDPALHAAMEERR